jgi:hypothetical protein
MTDTVDANRHHNCGDDPIPKHWSGEQALLVCDLLLAIHNVICDRYRREMFEALGEPLPGSEPFWDDELPF